MIDMLDMTDQQLNMHLEILLGAKEDRHRKGNVIKGDYSTSPKDYCVDPAASLEVQARAIELDAEGYVLNLSNQVAESLLRKTTSPYYGTLVSRMLNASPRERAEAAYMTLSNLD